MRVFILLIIWGVALRASCCAAGAPPDDPQVDYTFAHTVEHALRQKQSPFGWAREIYRRFQMHLDGFFPSGLDREIAPFGWTVERSDDKFKDLYVSRTAVELRGVPWPASIKCVFETEPQNGFCEIEYAKLEIEPNEQLASVRRKIGYGSYLSALLDSNDFRVRSDGERWIKKIEIIYKQLRSIDFLMTYRVFETTVGCSEVEKGGGVKQLVYLAMCGLDPVVDHCRGVEIKANQSVLSPFPKGAYGTPTGEEIHARGPASLFRFSFDTEDKPTE